MADNENVVVYDWNSTIEVKETPTFITLKPGEYQYKVTGIEKEWYKGGDNLPPCPKAVIKIHIETSEGNATVFENIFLTSKAAGFINAFFKSIGDIDPETPIGAQFPMDWDGVIGKIGRAKVGQREYSGNTYNTVKTWIPKAKTPAQNNWAI